VERIEARPCVPAEDEGWISADSHGIHTIMVAKMLPQSAMSSRDRVKRIPFFFIDLEI